MTTTGRAVKEEKLLFFIRAVEVEGSGIRVALVAVCGAASGRQTHAQQA